MLLAESKAVTVKPNAVPDVDDDGADTAKWVAAPRPTAIELEVPAIEEFAVSVAVIVQTPVVLSVAEKVPAPFVRVKFGGTVPLPSLLVKCTVPV